MNKSGFILILTNECTSKEIERKMVNSDKKKEEIDKQIKFIKNFIEFIDRENDFVSYEDSINVKQRIQKKMSFAVNVRKDYNEPFTIIYRGTTKSSGYKLCK